MSQRILEAVGAVAGSSLEQTSWLSRNLEVKAQPQVCLQGDEDDHDGNEFEGKPTLKYMCFQYLLLSFSVAQIVEHGASNAKIMGSIPKESKSWSNVKTGTWMQC